MSLDVGFEGARHDLLQVKKNELNDLHRSHRRSLRSLRAVSALVAKNATLSSFAAKQLDLENSPPDISDDEEFLKANALSSGRGFDESTLPYPSILKDDDSIYASKPTRQSSQPLHPVQVSASADGPAIEATLTIPADPDSQMASAAPPDTHSIRAPVKSDQDAPHTYLEVAATPDDAAVTPVNFAPPLAEEEAQLSVATKDLLDSEAPHRPAKTVHLPPKDVQEERLRERREAEAEERRKSESERASRPSHLQAQAELASSPSSTVGAYSAATPLPPQDSPDTSPDSETAEMEMPLPPKDLRPTPEEQHAKEEHDRLLEAQKEIAKREALGAEQTPDEQLQWEAREAAARDEEERAAREDVNGPEADPKNELEVTQAQDMLQEVVAEAVLETDSTSPTGQKDVMPQPIPTPPVSQTNEHQEDGDNIIVTPRVRAPRPIDTSMHPPPIETSAPPARMITRVSSGALSRRSVSEILGETSAHSDNHPSARLERRVASPEAISPMTVRQSQDAASVPPASQLQTPRRTQRTPGLRSQDKDLSASLRDLAPLKGAAEDPERDYLEPLFRIQAHDSPNSSTKPLPELVKVANKYLSTDDQFTSLHERMDYRILRRIYQLQNANKWSLRQMEKAKEPEQPVTHWDHMMAEMKWMRKDFKAERRMKKSVCAWLAARCAEWKAAGPEDRKAMQVKSKVKAQEQDVTASDQVPELEVSGESATEDEMMPSTPQLGGRLPMTLVVAPELSGLVNNLQKAGKLSKALHALPVAVAFESASKPRPQTLTAVSKFVEGKILPHASGPARKRSRYEYEDDAEVLDSRPESKRLRDERDLPSDSQEVALFHPDNKHIRDRLHANNAFRPPSEFVMPHTSFYEFRNGSQWIWEDDQKLRKLAKEYSFNWSLIADEMILPSRYKSSAERRTPWECFERWVELETLPAEMRKTMYFKTWFQRLEQSQNAAERRYQAQIAAMQAQAQQNGQQAPIPQRKRSIPTRVEKRKNTRYLWMLDAMRKAARKRESNAFKQAEAQRAAAQRKTQSDNNPAPRQQILTPQEFSKRRHERDVQFAEVQRQHKAKIFEAQQRQLQMARAAQQGGPNGTAAQQRPGTANALPQNATQVPVNGQQNPNINGQLPQQARPALPMATRNGHLAVPQVNAQGIPQAQMRSGPVPDMQRFAQTNGTQRAGPYSNQQPYQMPNGNMPSPGSGLTTQQQLQHNQQLLSQLSAQQQANQMPHGQGQPHNVAHQMSGSPSMPPPPTPHAQAQQPGQLSSGHVPALMVIKNQLRAKHPNLSEAQLNEAATSELRTQSQSQSSSQARQNAMNAAAGIQAPVHHNNNMQAYAHNQAAFQNNQMPNGNAAFINGESGASPAPSMNQSPQAAALYANQLRNRQMAMMRMSPNATHAQLNGSPGLAHASPSMTPVSPSMTYSNMAAGQVPGMAGRPSSRSNTPQMQRVGSSNSVPGVGLATGMQSPGALQQGSPRNMQASMAR